MMIPTPTSLPRVLFVDDEPQLLESFEDGLHRQFEVVTATSGADGLRVLERTPPFTIVVSDFQMPGMNGAEFLAKAKILSPQSVRVLLSGQATVQGAIAAVNDGNVFRFLTKPCSPAELRRALDDALEQARLVTADRELLERKLDNMVAQLRRTERLASLGTMAGAIGHELNNALTALTCSLDMIRRDATAGRVPPAMTWDASSASRTT